MTTEALAYRFESTKPFPILLQSIQEEVVKRNFRVLHAHDIQGTLAEKGFELTPYTVMEVCGGGFAHKLLTTMPEAGMMLPCRIVVYEDAGKNTVLFMKPTLIGQLIPDTDFDNVPEDVERILLDALQAALEEA